MSPLETPTSPKIPNEMQTLQTQLQVRCRFAEQKLGYVSGLSEALTETLFSNKFESRQHGIECEEEEG
jgi:hypothetical protein